MTHPTTTTGTTGMHGTHAHTTHTGGIGMEAQKAKFQVRATECKHRKSFVAQARPNGGLCPKQVESHIPGTTEHKVRGLPYLRPPLCRPGTTKR